MAEKKKYSAYNGLARVAMVWGVPFMAALCVFVPIVILTIAAAAVWGPGALVLITLAIPILLFFKQMCETDEQALRILALEVRCFLSRRLAKQFGNTFTLAPIKLGRRLAVYRQPFRKDHD
jgi:type IV secretion system protein VirB3